MADLNKINGKEGRNKKTRGNLGRHLAKKAEEDGRRLAESKLPPEAMCEYCGEMKRAYRDIGGKDDIARICTDCEKRAIDEAIGAPEFEDTAPRSNDDPEEEEGLLDGAEIDEPGTKEKAPARRRKGTKKKKNRAATQKIRRG